MGWFGSMIMQINRKDAAAVAALYTDDGVHVLHYGTSHGRQAIEKAYAKDFRNWHRSNHIDTVDRLNVVGNEIRSTPLATSVVQLNAIDKSTECNRQCALVGRRIVEYPSKQGWTQIRKRLLVSDLCS